MSGAAGECAASCCWPPRPPVTRMARPPAGVACDVGDPSSVDALMTAAQQALGGIDVLGAPHTGQPASRCRCCSWHAELSWLPAPAGSHAPESIRAGCSQPVPQLADLDHLVCNPMLLQSTMRATVARSRWAGKAGRAGSEGC